jgi:anti-sigma regulatory factor (Ser/Thr protein kinase)
LLQGRVDAAALHAAALLVTELVANSVKHVQNGPVDVIQLRVLLFAQHVRAEVIDHGPGFDASAVVGPRAGGEAGWGLFLLDQMADRWGVDHSHSTRVWFELARSSP